MKNLLYIFAIVLLTSFKVSDKAEKEINWITLEEAIELQRKSLEKL